MRSDGYITIPGRNVKHDDIEPLVDNMVSGNISVSQQVLVSQSNLTTSRKSTQYLAAIIATIGGLISGTVLGWTSPTSIPLENGQYGFSVSKEDMSWIGGTMSLGAVAGSVLTGCVVDVVGRKNLILLLVIPCTIGWASMIWAQSVLLFCIGRFLTGIAVGSYVVAIPLYTAETGEKEIRGTLGTYLQLQITIGILAMYIIGYYVNVFQLTVICGIIPLVYALLMVFIPESPFFHLKKGNEEKARSSLRWFRGPYYDIDSELQEIQSVIDKDEAEKVPFLKAFNSTAARRGLVIGLGVMFLQQFSGCNAVIFYTTSIFQEAGSSLNPSVSTIIVGSLSVITTWIATMVIDRLGRRILLLFSIVMCGLCTFALGLYFYMKVNLKMDVSSLGWLPVSSLSGFIIAFSLGFGPIPWMLMGEIFPSKIRGAASSAACFFNWSCVFVVTKYFNLLSLTVGTGVTFWIFTACSVCGIVFVFLFVPETKGKTLVEIQQMLGQRNSSERPEPKLSEVVEQYSAKVKL